MKSETTETTLAPSSGRRAFLRNLGIATASTAGLAAFGGAGTAHAGENGLSDTDIAVLNFALNLEYLEAEFYLQATTGDGLEAAGIEVGEKAGPVIVRKNPKVDFDTPAIRNYAEEIAGDESNHVRFLREVLESNGAKAVPRPRINLRESFVTLGELIGVDNFNPFANEVNFLVGAFIFEDVGVTAYRGASPVLQSKVVLEAAAGILGVEAYHAGTVRTLLYSLGSGTRALANRISAVRQSLDDSKFDLDQGIGGKTRANIVPANGNSVAFGRSTRQVLNIVYGGVDAEDGLFFPQGMNGPIR
ncbi:MAG: ferritin-like domain-containing protein [Verrucomicrobiota bacterium]